MHNPQLCDRIKRRHELPGDAEVGIKAAALINAEVDVGNRLVKGVISTTRVDLDGDVVLPFGMSTEYFEEFKSVYWNHDYNQLPVGTNRNIVKRANGIFASTYIRKGVFEDELLSAIEAGCVRGQSIGFRTLDCSPPDAMEKKSYGDDCRMMIRNAIMLEYSITPMPCNPGALIELVSKGVVSRDGAVRLGLPDSARRKFWDTGTVRAVEVVIDDDVAEVVLE